METTTTETTTKKRGGRPATLGTSTIDMGFSTPCHLWNGSTFHNGYGKLTRGGVTQYAHRYYYELEHGPIPKVLECDHLCRVRKCCNPEHIELVTHAENSRRGSMTKLRPGQVKAIRANYGTGAFTQKDLAGMYNVTPALVSYIVNGKRWADLN